MKIRTDHVTNSSSSSFTIVNFDSPTLEAWIREAPVAYGKDPSTGAPCIFRSFNELISFIMRQADALGEWIEIDEEEGLVGNLLHILGAGEGEEPREESLAPLAGFIRENLEAIEADGSGRIIRATQEEMEAPCIVALRHSDGQTEGGFVSLDEVELEEYVGDVGDWSDEVAEELAAKYVFSDEEE